MFSPPFLTDRQNKRRCPKATPFEVSAVRKRRIYAFFEANPYNLAAACLCVFVDWWRVSLWLICFSILVFQVRVSVEYHQTTFPFEISRDLCHTIFRWNTD